MEKDIVIAIQAEKDYLKAKQRGENPNIYIYLSPSGYTDLEEFQTDKMWYNLSCLDWDIVEQPRIDLNVTIEDNTTQTPAFFYSIYTGETYAFLREGYRDPQELQDLGYTTIEMGYNAENGLILSFDGDLRVYLIIPDEMNANIDTFLYKMNDYFLSKGLNSVIDNNDILIDGRKVCGGAEFLVNGMDQIVYQITFADHTEEIQRVCGASTKTPGWIPTDIVTPYELKDEFLSWLQ